MKKTGAQIFIESLIKEGVDTIFGFPGGAVLPVYDALYGVTALRHILVRHEQGAVHMADGYARATGKPGVVIVTSGPGATNTVTGIATAYMDSIPVVVFTGQVPTALIGNDAFQEADIVGITRPCTKHNYLVKDIKDLTRIIKEAFHIATTGRPGPVLVDLPKDVLSALHEFKYPEGVELRSYKPTYEGHPGQIKRAIELIFKSKRPLIYTGGGIILSNASEELTHFAGKLNIPVTNTLMGLGGFPGTHPLFLGMLGMHGTYCANMAVTNTDCLIAIGARFDDRVTGKIDEFAPYAKIIHVDIDPTSISKNVKVDIPIVGDVKLVLKDMLKHIDETKGLKAYKESINEWHGQIKNWAETHRLSYKYDDKKIKPQHVIERIFELTKGKAIITTEVGQNQMWAAQFYKFDKPRTFLTSGGLGTMGFGFPAAIGAQVAFPDKIVIDIAGDGSIQMNIQEMATAVQYKLPVKVAILNNKFLGMVRQWQEFFYEKRYSHTCISVAPDFVRLAEAYGAVGLRATKPEEVDPVIKEALTVKSKPVLMDFVVDPEEDVYPMVPAGQPLNKMLLV
ncbi:MAG: acetolactate synthase, large subunit, biosynthetic type [Deltaproteobacteria bacterium GWC2_42_51]|nr:MAG: acetolactate synthase, large subunit, biosynthetic type [Deltaproteobacteria bacterium GWC2_42_51]OGP38830.1 MAG: acetolactate synthase, large subunit, biosynthetic type [Deltaproteobacteria bacterium GWD2_42_10]OGQ24728.1 MAG: acetolactate synthase, large subunit, biosynthetic type [Deltaproteobacteria bacterium RIFCSPHIGHO2_02_FULL_42_44]OGQ36702.1 MAG: acetolactate synthase, large subunit, biosynthetic type [Deltaproteobacteria bacterium RIFCSPLOWO2_02_FULL_42_39]OGQ66521.1 MAG: acet